MRQLTTLFTCVLVGLIAAGDVQALRGGTEEQGRRWPRINDRLELRYTLEMERDGERIPVAATGGFESGDRFTLRVRPTEDAYLYLFVSDADGGYTPAAPDLEEDGSLPGAVEGGSDAWLPAGAVLRLDGEPGVERLYLLASTRRLNQVEELFGDERGQVDEAWLIDLRDPDDPAQHVRGQVATHNAGAHQQPAQSPPSSSWLSDSTCCGRCRYWTRP